MSRPIYIFIALGLVVALAMQRMSRMEGFSALFPDAKEDDDNVVNKGKKEKKSKDAEDDEGKKGMWGSKGKKDKNKGGMCAPGEKMAGIAPGECEYTNRISTSGGWACPSGWRDTGCSWGNGSASGKQCQKCTPDATAKIAAALKL